MPRSTEVLTLRVKVDTAIRVRAAAAQSGRTLNRYLSDLITAAHGAARAERIEHTERAEHAQAG